MCLLSIFVDDRTIDFRRSKKESGSMQRGLRVGTDFEKFRRTP